MIGKLCPGYLAIVQEHSLVLFTKLNYKRRTQGMGDVLYVHSRRAQKDCQFLEILNLIEDDLTEIEKNLQ